MNDLMKVKLHPGLVGVAGEYLVAGELSLRGFIAAITLRNSRGIDIVASNSDGTKSISIQVKTNSDGGSNWQLSKKADDFHSDNHFYVFVALQGLGKRPKFHIVPSKVVADFTRKNHLDWISGRKKDGTKRKVNDRRKFSDKTYEFLDVWQQLGLGDL